MSSLDLLGRFHDFMIWKLRFEAIAYAAIVEGVSPNQEPLSISAWLFFLSFWTKWSLFFGFFFAQGLFLRLIFP